MKFLFCSIFVGIGAISAAEKNIGYDKFAVATVHPLASDAATSTYTKGGNAVDAAIAAGLTLGVVDSHNSGIGGGCFIVIRTADGAIVTVDGRETAPAAAHKDLYVIGGKVDDKASKTGALASGVPGALKAYELVLKKYGKLPLADLLLVAADLAEEGFLIDEVFARRLASCAKELQLFPASAAIFLKPDGSPLQAGERLVQKDLAKTYRAIAKNGVDWFYQGEYAQKMEEWMLKNGGILRAEDFASYRAVERTPIRSTYRGYELICMPPPSSGGVHVAQILNILERFPIRHLKESSRIHVVTEAMKLAFADRAHWLGDPDYTPVPRGLIEKQYAIDLARKINLDHVTAVPAHNQPPRWDGDVFGKHTTHLSTADAEGNWVAMTQTINTGFGSKVVIPNTGVILNNEMDDFAVQPGVPNAFKLVGAESNAIEPGKRPLSSMSPTLVLKDGQPFLSLGAAGGPTIITQTLLCITHIIDDGLSVQEALAKPRFHQQWKPEELKIETRFSSITRREIEALGHQLDETTGFGACQAIMWDKKAKKFIPAHDPRIPGKASGL